MCEDDRRIGYGMAPAVDVVPALQRSHARLPAVVWARSCLRPGAPIVPEITLDRAPPAARPAPRLAVRIRLSRRGSPVHVPMTVEPPAGRFAACVVRT